MRFAWNETQQSFAATVADVLARACDPAAVRAVWEAGDGPVVLPAWAALADLGVLDALVPPDAGGLGLQPVDLVPVARVTGRAALPGPFVEHTFVAAAVLREPGVRATAALGPAGPVAHVVDVEVVVTTDGERLVAVGRDALRIEPVRSVDHSRRLARIHWDPAAARELGGPAEVAAAFDRGVVGFASQLVGLGEALLERTCRYVTERHQFGVPVGSFQAVKHKLADVAVALEFAAPLVARAAWSLSCGDPLASVHVSMAKAAAADAAELAARHALQCHGAIGYSWEYDLHLWLKRVWALSRTWGDAAWHRERVAREILEVPDADEPDGEERR